MAKTTVPTVRPGDTIIVRTSVGDMTFTGGEEETAMGIANLYVAKGIRVSVLVYTYRPTARKGGKHSIGVLFTSRGGVVRSAPARVA